MNRIETMHMPWTFFRDNAKDWIRMMGTDVYLCSPHDVFDIRQFPWHLNVKGGDASGFLNSLPDGLRFSATDVTTGIEYRWTVDIYVRATVNDGANYMDAGRINDVMSKIGSECRAKVVETLKAAVKRIDEDIANADRWRNRCLTNKGIILGALGGDA